MTRDLLMLTMRRLLAPAAALAAMFALSGCVAYPTGYGGYAYAPAPVYVAPAPVVVGGGYWGGRGWRRW